MIQKYSLGNIDTLQIPLNKPSIVFLYWDLWAGKTTLSQKIISQYTKGEYTVNSPTYVYYNRYEDIYHFDLYRIHDYDEFISIGGEEVLDNNNGIILVEWPELIEKYYQADIKIYITQWNEQDERNIEIIYNK